MKKIIQHPVYGEIVYNESFWTGKKTLTINGVDALPLSKKAYLVNGKKAHLTGSFLLGSNLHLEEGETIPLSPEAKWYEIVLSILPFLFLIIWGNNASLCAIFPVLGGGIGGGLGALGMVISQFYMKKQNTPLAKVLIGILVAAVTIFISFVLALALILLLIA